MKLRVTIGLLAVVLGLGSGLSTSAVDITICDGQSSGSTGWYRIIDLKAHSRYAEGTDIHKSNSWLLDDAYLDGLRVDGKFGAFNAAFSQLASHAEGNHYGLQVDFSNYQALLDAITGDRCNDTILGEAGLFQPAGAGVPDGGSTLALFAFALSGLAYYATRRRLQPVLA